MQIRPQQLRSLDIVPPIQLLVDRVRRVGGAAHGEEEDVFAGRLLEGDGDGDAVHDTGLARELANEGQNIHIPPTFPRKIRLHAKHLLRRLARRREVPVLRACHPPFPGML